MVEVFRRRVIKLLVDCELLNEDFAGNLLSWKHSGFRIDNSVRILDKSAQESLAEYIARPPISLGKIHYEPFKGRVLFHTKYSEYFKQNLHMFDALDFLAELTQHIPPKGLGEDGEGSQCEHKLLRGRAREGALYSWYEGRSIDPRSHFRRSRASGGRRAPKP
ncbi:MAG: transposase [Spirochaetota bacterium]